MTQKKTIPTWLNVLCLVLIVGCLAWTVYGMFGSTEHPKFNGNEPPAQEQGEIQAFTSDRANSNVPQGTVRFNSDHISTFFADLRLNEITIILALIAALIYSLQGYNKKASLFF